MNVIPAPPNKEGAPFLFELPPKGFSELVIAYPRDYIRKLSLPLICKFLVLQHIPV